MHRDGPTALNMERLADEARISKSVVYTHFASRTDLLMAMLEESWVRLDKHLEASMAGAQSFEARVRASITAYFDAIADRGPLLQTIVSEVSTDPEVEEHRLARRKNVVRFWAKQAVQEFGIPYAIAEAAAATLVAATEGAAKHWLTSDTPRELAEEIAFVANTQTARHLVRQIERLSRLGRTTKSSGGIG